MNNLFKRFALVQIGLIVFSLIVMIILLTMIKPLILKKNSLAKEIDQKNLALVQIEKTIDSLTTEFNGLMLMSLNSFGWPKNELQNINYKDDKVRRAIEANTLIRKIVFENNFEINDEIIIQYYPKSNDKYKVAIALEEFGFTLVKKQSNPAMVNEETNAIWFGDAVSEEYAKIVAYTLIRAGVELKFIRSSAGIPDNKIIIGAVKPHSKYAVLNAKEIREMKEFDRVKYLKK